MDNKIPEIVYYKIFIGFIFSLLIIWYFSFRLTSQFLLPFLLSVLTAYLTFTFSLIVCLMLIKRTIEIEIKDKDIPFSVVARNPDIPIPEEKITLQLALKKLTASLAYTFLLGVPLTLIGLIRVFTKKDTFIDIMGLFLESYWIFYAICFLISMLIAFVFIPSLKGWHWTKLQF